MLRLTLILVCAAGCTKQTQVRAPQPAFDVSRICDDARSIWFSASMCSEMQAPSALPTTSPIRVDTNLATPPSIKLATRV